MVRHRQIQVESVLVLVVLLSFPLNPMQLQVKAKANGLGTVNRLHSLHVWCRLGALPYVTGE